MSVTSDTARIEQLEDTISQLESWIKLQETTMEWEIEQRCEKQLNAEYQRGRSDGYANGSSSSHVLESLTKALQNKLDDILPKMIDSSIPEKYRSSFSGNIRATPRVSHWANPSSYNTTHIGVRVHIEPCTIAIDQIIRDYF